MLKRLDFPFMFLCSHKTCKRAKVPALPGFCIGLA